jgi:hypothetical protein
MTCAAPWPVSIGRSFLRLLTDVGLGGEVITGRSPLLAPWLNGEVEHVGSTAIPGLPATPIIDLQAPVTDLTTAEAIARVLAPLGCPG